MARKSIIKGYKLVTAHTLATSFNSAAVGIDYMDNIGFIFDCSSVTDNTGTFSIQARIKADENSFSAWATLAITGLTLANAAVALPLDMAAMPWSEIRVVFTAAGGTPNGSVNVWMQAKQAA